MALDETHKGPSRQTVGMQGEQLATRYLSNNGYEIRAQNWRSGKSGEIDVIAYHPVQDILVFVEVKTRRTLAFGTPLESITPQKQQRIVHVCEQYLQQYPPAPQTRIRFDVIGVTQPRRNGPCEMEHLEDAFGALS